jgi:hypothetical protein
MDEEWGASDLFGSAGPDEQQWNVPNQQYDISDHSNSVDLSGYDNYGSKYQVSDQPDMSWQSNISNSPMEGWQQNGTNWGNIDQQLGSTFNSPQQRLYDNTQGLGSGTSNFLSQLFSGSQGQGGKGLLTGLGAVLEGMQNKKKASSVQNIVNQQQARMDPFGSQRPQYQQELSRTMQDPYSAPIVRNQVQQMQQAQAIKDAAAGRRSNQATSNPALMAAQAQVAQKYMDSLYQPAGANISPNASGLSELMQGNNAAINGYASPLMSALGYNSGSNQNSAQMQAIVDALAKFKAGQ